MEDNRTLLKQLEKALIQLDQCEDQAKQEEKIRLFEAEIKSKTQEIQTQEIIIQSHLESIIRLQTVERKSKEENDELKVEIKNLKEKYDSLEGKNTLVVCIIYLYLLCLILRQTNK